MGKSKKTMFITLLSILLMFNIYGTYGYYEENYINKEIESKEVTIIDKYSIANGENNSDSYYMKGQDESGNIIVILGDKYSIGDEVTVFKNINSANANGGDVHWHTTIEELERSSLFSMILFGFFTIINLFVLVHYIRKPAITSSYNRQ